MTGEQLRTLHQARPFRRLVMHLADGRSVVVRHPELLFQTQGGRTVVVNTSGEELAIIDLLLVTQLSVGEANGAARRGRRRKQ